MNEQEIIADIKNALQAPLALLEMMKNRELKEGDIPVDLFEISIVSLRQAVDMLNKLANWR